MKRHQPHNLQNTDFIAPLLDSAISDLEKNQSTGGLLNISIDNIPMIISCYNATIAEEIVHNLIEKIMAAVGPGDQVIRGDKEHISVILKDYNKHEMKIKAMEIYHLIQHHGSLDQSRPIQIMATIGAVELPQQVEDAKDAMNKTYVALNDAKESMQHYMIYEDMERHTLESKNKMSFASYLHRALLKNNLRLAYQPIVNIDDGSVFSYEALLRIVNPDGTLSSAGPFIPMAEKMGFIEMIDAIVLEMSIRELKSTPDIRLSINISNNSIYSSAWLRMAMVLLDDVDLANRLTVEITETAQQHDLETIAQFIVNVQALGCKVALDDFGAGYTSFTQLNHLPVDIIKIDGSFIRDINVNEKSKFFVETLVGLGKKLNTKIIAEYVENAAIIKELRKIGNIDYLQGNYLSPAVNFKPWEAIEKDYKKLLNL